MDARTELTNAYKTYLGRDINQEKGQLDWRLGQVGTNPIANQINEIKNSDEAKKYSAKNIAAKSVVAAKPTTPQPGTSQALTGELAAFDSTAQNPVDIYNSALEKLGISDARTRVTDLRKSLVDNQNLLDNLSGNIAQRTAGALVTESQRQKLQASEAAPIIEQGNQLNQQFGLAQEDYNTITGEAKTQADLITSGQSAKRQALLDRLKIAIDSEQNAEKKKQWQAEYDRQVKLDKEAKINADRNYALDVQKANEPKTEQPTVGSLFEGYDPKTDKWYTEQVVIPTLMSTYNYTKDKASKLAYDYRKSVFGE